MKTSLLHDYQQFVAAAVKNNHNDNYDLDRFGPQAISQSRGTPNQASASTRLKSDVRRLLSRAKWAMINTLKTPAQRRELVRKADAWIGPNLEKLQWLWEKLADKESGDLLIRLLAYRALGHRHVKLPLSTSEFWRERQQLKLLRNGVETLETGFMDWKVYRTNLQSIGYPFEIFVLNVQEVFVLEQYRAQFAGGVVEVSPGDVVIDAGGCYGDTAFYFAHKAGPDGHVYSFEFLPENLRIFETNLKINPEFAQRISLVTHPLWSEADSSLFIEGSGPATRVLERSNLMTARVVQTLSIDALVAQQSLQHIDFIKMDIEGAELAALRGAKESIIRFRPKLAISVYHRLSDFWEIAEFIDNLGLGYRFHLKHFTIHQEETVLFADVPRLDSISEVLSSK